MKRPSPDSHKSQLGFFSMNCGDFERLPCAKVNWSRSTIYFHNYFVEWKHLAGGGMQALW